MILYKKIGPYYYIAVGRERRWRRLAGVCWGLVLDESEILFIEPHEIDGVLEARGRAERLSPYYTPETTDMLRREQNRDQERHEAAARALDQIVGVQPPVTFLWDGPLATGDLEHPESREAFQEHLEHLGFKMRHRQAAKMLTFGLDLPYGVRESILAAIGIAPSIDEDVL